MDLIYCFADFRLDTRTWSLSRDGQPTPLGVRAVRLLGALVARANEYVSKEELLETAWPGLIVEEANLSVQMTTIRRVLEKGFPGRCKVETLPRRGYRFLGDVATGNEQAPAGPPINPNNLPQPATSFIGREIELSALKRLLGEHRLLTLAGSGGCGKTRLALQLAGESLTHFPDGAWLVELAPVTDPARVAQTLSTVLGLKPEPGKLLVETLAEHLKTKKLLLLLDNCEHLLDACAQLADALIRRSSYVKILVSLR